MQKDILTKEKILLDYKAIFKRDLKFSLPMLTIIFIFLYFFTYLSLISQVSSELFFGTVFILFILMLIFCGFYYYPEFRKLDILKNEKFRITTDKLETISGKDFSFKRRLLKKLSLERDSAQLIFASYGKYFIPLGMNYSSSTLYKMSNWSVINSSSIGDKFYLVIYKDKYILSAYNTKMFELQE